MLWLLEEAVPARSKFSVNPMMRPKENKGERLGREVYSPGSPSPHPPAPIGTPLPSHTAPKLSRQHRSEPQLMRLFFLSPSSHSPCPRYKLPRFLSLAQPGPAWAPKLCLPGGGDVGTCHFPPPHLLPREEPCGQVPGD